MSGMTKSLFRAPSRSASLPRFAASPPQINVNDVPRLDRPLPLICGACGTKGKYHVGTVLIDPQVARSEAENAIEQAIGFTGYFRCKKCNAGGPWLLPDVTVAFITVMMMDLLNDVEDVPLFFGATVTFDKRVVRYATEGEAHLKTLIEKEPERAFLWVRLGNLYSHANLHDRAESAYHRALELDPVDIEAHSMLGQHLDEIGRTLEAVPHWHAVLKNVREARQVNRDLRRNLARSAIQCLLDAHAQSKGKFDLFPSADPAEFARNHNRNEPVVLELREFNLGSDRGIDELCDYFLEPPRRGWRNLFGRNKKSVIDEPDGWAVTPIRRDAVSVPRNNPCPCGSGHKFKKCCGR